MAGDNKPGVDISIPVDDFPAEESNVSIAIDEEPSLAAKADATAKGTVDKAGDLANEASLAATEALATHEDATKKANDVINLADRVAAGEMDPNKKVAKGDASGETAGCMASCKNDDVGHCRGAIEIFGTIIESIVAPVAGPCGYYWFHKCLVAFAIFFFLINLGMTMDKMANGTVTDIRILHMKKITYPDIYMCIPAYSYFYSFVCCGDTCGSGTVAAVDKCQSIAILNLANAATVNGCSMGMTTNPDLGKTASDSCPYTPYVGDSIGTSFDYAAGSATGGTFRQKYSGAEPTIYDQGFTWTKSLATTNEWATGLENRRISSVQLIRQHLATFLHSSEA